MATERIWMRTKANVHTPRNDPYDPPGKPQTSTGWRGARRTERRGAIRCSILCAGEGRLPKCRRLLPWWWIRATPSTPLWMLALRRAYDTHCARWRTRTRAGGCCPRRHPMRIFVAGLSIRCCGSAGWGTRAQPPEGAACVKSEPLSKGTDQIKEGLKIRKCLLNMCSRAS